VLPFHRILCPLDFSEPSYTALHSAAEMALHFKAELVMVHVIPPAAPGIPADSSYAFAGVEDYEKALRLRAEEQFSVAAEALPEGIKSRNVIATGDAANEIVRLSKDESADLIVIATHGLTGWRHLIFGSVAEKVIRHSYNPVLVVPIHEPN